MFLKSIINYFSGRTREKSERFIRAAYFGLLHRLPETTSLEAQTIKIMNGANYYEIIESIIKSSEFMRNLPPSELNSFFEATNASTHQSDTKSLSFSGSLEKVSPQNLVYFCPAISAPLGGVKVIARHSEIINRTRPNKLRSELFFPENHKFNLDWFQNDIETRTTAQFNREADVIILPEVWVLKYGSTLIDNGIKYAIFIQNGYYIFDEVYRGHQPSLIMLKKIYENASFILSISEDTSLCIELAFNVPRNRIFKVKPSVNSAIFKHRPGSKKNIITYMPRKLPQHSNWIINQLSLKLNTDWEIIPIEDANENAVAEMLSISKIFLSFSDREGFSIPPLEAIFSGNSVIGYTGEGAKEYWNPILFKEVSHGNMRDFLEKILTEVKLLSNQEFLDIDPMAKIKTLDLLRTNYSLEQEATCLSDTLDTIMLSKLIESDVRAEQ